MALWMTLAGACSDSDTPEEPNPAPVPIEVALTQVVQTQYQHLAQNDLYYLSLASGEVTFDEELLLYRTSKEGMVMNICLYAPSATDPTHPVLPVGTYPLAGSMASGTWSSNPDQNVVVIRSASGDTELATPTAGEISLVQSEAGIYRMTASFTLNEEQYAVTYEGELPISGLPDSIKEAVEVELIGGQAVYQGADAVYTDLGFVQLELWDAEPDPENGQVMGHFMKLKLYTDLPATTFMGVPAGSYMVGATPAPYAAEPGYDDGVNIPTGCYITDRTEGNLRLSMITSGVIEVTTDGCVSFDLQTSDGVSVVGSLDEPMDLVDLTSGFGSGGSLSTLTSDMSFDFPATASAMLLDYSDFYGNGTRNATILILDTESLYGLVLDLILPAAERYAPLPEGHFTLDKGYRNTFTFVPGTMQFGQPAGSYFCNFELPDYYLGNLYAPLCDGTVDISVNAQGDYTIVVDMYDDAKTPHSVKASYVGLIENYE